MPRNLFVAEITLHTVGEPSQIMSEEHFRSIASVMPPLERMKSWSMSYSTRVHGISLATLYRRQTFGLPSLLVVKDFGGAGGGGGRGQRMGHLFILCKHACLVCVAYMLCAHACMVCMRCS